MNIWKYPDVKSEILESFEETYSIDDDISVTSKTPIKMSFYKDVEVSKWSDILVSFFEQLKMNEADKFELLLSEHIDGKIKKVIDNSSQNMRKALEVSPSTFIETNLSSNHILRNIKVIYDYLELDI